MNSGKHGKLWREILDRIHRILSCIFKIKLSNLFRLADVRRALNAAAGLDVGSLVVRKLPNGICLEGIIHVSSDDLDVCSLVREIEGVGKIVNNLVVCWNCPHPASDVHDEMFM